MNCPRALLRTVEAAGLTLAAAGGKLRLTGPACAITPDVRRAVASHKPALLGLLAPQTAYTLISDAAGLGALPPAVLGSAGVALDCETTGLNPHKDRARLLQLATATEVFLLDLYALDPAALGALFAALAGVELVLHNAGFDLAFLWRLGFRPGKVFDLLLMSRLLTAGTTQGNSLAELAERELGITLDKSHQKAAWSGALSPAMLSYAALDARVTFDLYEPVAAKIKQAGLGRVADIENRAVPAFVWLTASGAPFDGAAWEALAVEAETRVAALEERLYFAAPPRPGSSRWNWNSPKQLAEVFALAGIDLPRTAKGNPSTGDAVLAALDHPLAALLREHRQAAQLLKAFGRQWLGFAAEGRIYAGWNQLGAASGRSSCKAPNLQQVPKDPRYRACFQAPPGRVIIKADYGQLQLRIAAKLTGDQAMLDAYARGEDLHTATARRITGKAEVTKDERQLAKALNFGLLFGMGARALRGYACKEYGVELSEGAARKYRAAFFQAYAGLAEWHRASARDRWRCKIRLETVNESRTFLGRRRLFDAQTPLPFLLNSPVQGAEADGAKLALALLGERRGQCPGAVPVLFVHDEICVEADEGQVEAAAGWLQQAMLDGMRGTLDPVPCEVEVAVGYSWGQTVPLEKWVEGLRPAPAEVSPVDS
jgi:DNA polymerase-1